MGLPDATRPGHRDHSRRLQVSFHLGQLPAPTQQRCGSRGQPAPRVRVWCSRGGSSRDRSQALVVGEDHRFDLPQPWAGLDAELLHEPLSDCAERRQRLGLPAGPVEGVHQQRPQLLAERVLGGKPAQDRDRVPRVVLHQHRHPGLGRLHPPLGQPGRLRRQSRCVESRERRPGPLHKRSVDVTGGQAVLEAGRVDAVWTQGKAVPDTRALHGGGSERRSELHHVGLQDLLRRPGRVLCPDQVDQPGDRDGLAADQRKRRQHGTPLGRAELDRVAGHGGRDTA